MVLKWSSWNMKVTASFSCSGISIGALMPIMQMRLHLQDQPSLHFPGFTTVPFRHTVVQPNQKGHPLYTQPTVCCPHSFSWCSSPCLKSSSSHFLFTVQELYTLQGPAQVFLPWRCSWLQHPPSPWTHAHVHTISHFICTAFILITSHTF